MWRPAGLLRHPKRRHPDRPVPACALKYRLVTATFRSPLTNRATGMWLTAANRRTTSRTVPPPQERDREPPLGQVLHPMPANLQIRHAPVEVNPIQTLPIEGHMPIKDVVRRPAAHGQSGPEVSREGLETLHAPAIGVR
jgi:hypothetical protein